MASLLGIYENTDTSVVSYTKYGTDTAEILLHNCLPQCYYAVGRRNSVKLQRFPQIQAIGWKIKDMSQYAVACGVTVHTHVYTTNSQQVKKTLLYIQVTTHLLSS